MKCVPGRDKLLRLSLACCLVGLCAGRAPAADANATQPPRDLVMGPYVNSVTDTSARVLWVARPGVSGRCRLSDDTGREAAAPKITTRSSAITGREELLHTATVSGLKPGQTYHYTVTCGGERAEGVFQTAPPIGSREPLKFIVYGDPQTCPERHSKVVGAVLKEAPFAFLAISGDLAEDSSDWADLKKSFFDPARPLLRRTALWTVRGNWETSDRQIVLQALMEVLAMKLITGRIAAATVVLGAVLLLAAAPSVAKVYVVDQGHPQASDDNAGSESRPFKTIARAAKVAGAGDSVAVMAGDYAERIKLAASGAKGRPITFQAFPALSVTMRGFDTGGRSYLKIEGFRVISDNPPDRTPGIVIGKGGRSIEVVGNRIENMYMGISGGATDVRVAYNKIYKTQFGLLCGISSANWIIECNDIERQFQHRAGDCDYMRMWGKNHLLRYNYYHGTKRSEIGKAHLDCVQSFNVKKDRPEVFLHHLRFEYNVCNTFSQVFMMETNTPGTHHHLTFRNNILYNSGSWGFCVKNIPDCVATNNTFAGIKWYGFGNARGQRGRADNNLFAEINTPYTTGPEFQGRRNLVFKCENPPKKAPEGEFFEGDPKFADPEKGNFRLTEGSAAIDAGTDGLDIGALEYPNVYYVDPRHPGASDDGFGYAGWPFKTAAKACAVAQAGQTIILRRGTYRELIKPQSDNITIRAAKGESVVASGADLVGGWTRTGGKWSAPLSGKPAKLLLDGKPSTALGYDTAAKRLTVSGLDPRLHTIEVVIRENAVDLSGRKNVKLDGIRYANTLGAAVAGK